ncbi:hypothetical protein VTK56DRAFT_5322 [Thermocarpiscus australiensis]
MASVKIQPPRQPADPDLHHIPCDLGTIVETLDSNDRLGIVTFAGAAKVLQKLTPMTPENKAETLKKIEQIKPLDITSLWHGILNLFRDNGQPDSIARHP